MIRLSINFMIRLNLFYKYPSNLCMLIIQQQDSMNRCQTLCYGMTSFQRTVIHQYRMIFLTLYQIYHQYKKLDEWLNDKKQRYNHCIDLYSLIGRRQLRRKMIGTMMMTIGMKTKKKETNLKNSVRNTCSSLQDLPRLASPSQFNYLLNIIISTYIIEKEY